MYNMVAIEATTRKWGGSIGVIIPREIVESEGIEANKKIRITIEKTPLAKILWRCGPVRKTESTQKIKDELRAGW